MTQKTKNIIRIILLILLNGILVYLYVNNLTQNLLKILMILAALVNIVFYIRHIKRIKYFSIGDGTLIIDQTFSEQKKYNLAEIAKWSENHYHFLGIKTSNEIVIITTAGEKIKLPEKNSRDFEKLSDYLNEKFPSKYENMR